MTDPVYAPGDGDELPEADFGGVFYRWTCECGEVNEQKDDPRGQVVECEMWGEEYRVAGDL